MADSRCLMTLLVAAIVLVVDLAPPLWIVIRAIVSYAVQVVAG